MDIQHVVNMSNYKTNGILSQIQASNTIHYKTISNSHLQNLFRNLSLNNPKPKYVWTDKRILAQKRNFNKYRLMGFNLDRKALTPEELVLFNDFKSMMIDKWDERTGQLGLVPRKAIKEQKYDFKNGDRNIR